MIKKFLFLTLSAYLIVGCSDDTSSNEQEITNSSSSIEKIQGRVVDGEISNATVFFDKNKNGLLDDGEISTKTDNKGYYTLEVNSSDADDYTIPIVAFGGKDIRLDSDFQEVLMAFRDNKSDSLNITPLSTLIAHDVLDNLIEDTQKTSKTQFRKITSEELFDLLNKAQEDFANIFSLDISIITQDPIEIALSGNLDLLKTNSNINSVAREIKKAIKQEIREATRDAIQSYRALSKALKEAQKEAKKGNEALEESINFITEVEPDVFNPDVIPTLKAVTHYTLDVLDATWEENKDSILEALRDESEFVQLQEAETTIENEISAEDNDGDGLPDSTNFIDDNNTTTSTLDDNSTIQDEESNISNNIVEEENTTTTTIPEEENTTDITSSTTTTTVEEQPQTTTTTTDVITQPEEETSTTSSEPTTSTTTSTQTEPEDTTISTQETTDTETQEEPINNTVTVSTTDTTSSDNTSTTDTTTSSTTTTTQDETVTQETTTSSDTQEESNTTTSTTTDNTTDDTADTTTQETTTSSDTQEENNTTTTTTDTTSLDETSTTTDNTTDDTATDTTTQEDTTTTDTTSTSTTTTTTSTSTTTSSTPTATNDSPEITLNGDNPQIVVLGNEYSELGAVATDSEDGELSVDINNTEVNVKKLGDYNVTYTAIDSDDNQVQVTRLVQVVNPEILVSELNTTTTKCASWNTIQVPNTNEYYTLSNNDWGRQYLDSNSDGVQCVFSFNENNITKGGWYWGWPDNNDYQVKGYPEAIYGAKFSRILNPDSGFPILVKDIGVVNVDLNYRDFNITNRYNIALEFWLHTDINTSMDNIEYEIMFRFDPDGFHPTQTLLGTQTLGGIEFDIYKDRDYDGTQTRTFINYVAKSKVSDININFKEALDYLSDVEFSDIPQTYMSGIEMGVEVISGSGALVLDNLDVNLTQADKNITILATPKTTTRVYEEYQFKLDIESEGDYNVTFYNAPDWLEFNKTEGIVTGIVPAESEGNYTDINITITNEYNISKSLKFNLEVQPAQNIAKLYGIATQPPQDDYYWYLAPSYAIDGNLSTYNHTQDDESLNWIEVKLPQDTLTRKIVVFNRDDSTVAYRLNNAKLYICENSINSDIANLSQCDEVYTLSDSLDAQIWENNNSITGNYIVIKADSDYNLHIAEIEAYGTLPTTPNFVNSEFNTTIDKWQNTTESIYQVNAIDYQNDSLTYDISNDVPFLIDENGEIKVDNLLENNSYDINVTISDGINENSQIIHIDIQDTPIVKEAIEFNTPTPTVTGYLPNIYNIDDNITVEINGTTYTPIISDENWTVPYSDINPPLTVGDYNVTVTINDTSITYENYINIYKSRYQKQTESLEPELISEIDVSIESQTITPLEISQKVRGSSISLTNDDNGNIILKNDSYRTLSSLVGRYKDDNGDYVYVKLNFSENIPPYSTNTLEEFDNSSEMEVFNTAGSFDLEIYFGSPDHECSASENNETVYCNPTTINDEVYSDTASQVVKDGNMSEQQIYTVMLSTFHHFFNSINGLNTFRAWVYETTYKGMDFTGDYHSFDDYQTYVQENGFTRDSYINYHFMHMIIPDHEVEYLAMRYQYAAEGMASMGGEASLFGYQGTSGWASLWEGTLDLNHPIDYQSTFHETMHTYGFDHDSGITYGWSRAFLQIVPTLYELAKAPSWHTPKYFFDTKLKEKDKIQVTFYKTSEASSSDITIDFFSAAELFDQDFQIVKESDDSSNQITLIRNNTLFDRLILRAYNDDDSLEIASKIIDFKDYFLEVGKIAQDSNGSDYYAIGKQDWLNAYQVYENNTSLTNFKTAVYDIYKGCRAILGKTSDVAYDENTTNIENYGDIIRDTIPTLKVVERKEAWYKYYVRDFSENNDSDNWGDRLEYYEEPPIDDAYIMCIVPK